MKIKVKQFTENQIKRLPDDGYLIEYYITVDLKSEVLSRRPSLYCIKNGSVKYIHWLWGSDWSTLLWSCCPTKNAIQKSNDEFVKNGDNHLGFYYKFYKTHEDMLLDNPNLDDVFKIKAPNDMQRYVHDCDECKFVGVYKEHDLYFCKNEPTVIARYGNEGYEYSSGLVFAEKDGSKPLYEAKKNAIRLNLL